MRNDKSKIDIERLKRYMSVPAEEKLKLLARWQAFSAKLTTPRQRAMRAALKKKGF